MQGKILLARWSLWILLETKTTCFSLEEEENHYVFFFTKWEI